jgi:putative membrane protein
MAAYLALFKSLHIIGFVGWFGGLFYLVRMFVYHVEAFDKPEPAREILSRQYNIMEWRVYNIICVSGLLLTWIFGTIIIFYYGWDWFKYNPWLHVKIALVILLSGYQHYCKGIIKKLEKGIPVMSSFRFRLFNEVPTILLLAIVLLAVYKNTLDFGIALLGIVIFAVAIYLITRWYKSIRDQSN